VGQKSTTAKAGVTVLTPICSCTLHTVQESLKSAWFIMCSWSLRF